MIKQGIRVLSRRWIHSDSHHWLIAFAIRAAGEIGERVFGDEPCPYTGERQAE